jgi:hypothetical protein
MATVFFSLLFQHNANFCRARDGERLSAPLSSVPAIKDDINFFLDFDFQPLYTFINCGFLLRTAHPLKMERENRNMATNKKAKKKSKKK